MSRVLPVVLSLCLSLSLLLSFGCSQTLDPNTLLATSTLYDFESPLASGQGYVYNPPVTVTQPWTWTPSQGGVGRQPGPFDPPGATTPPHNQQVLAQPSATRVQQPHHSAPVPPLSCDHHRVGLLPAHSCHFPFLRFSPLCLSLCCAAPLVCLVSVARSMRSFRRRPAMPSAIVPRS